MIFAGGLAVGWGAAGLVGLLLGRVEGNAFIEISLTTVLAYLAYLVAEKSLGVSGVIAALAAGLLIGGWGKAKISPSVAGYLERHWAYLAAVANSLVFLMVGLRVEVGPWWRSSPSSDAPSAPCSSREPCRSSSWSPWSAACRAATR